jgi:hypothetical protein
VLPLLLVEEFRIGSVYKRYTLSLTAPRYFAESQSICLQIIRSATMRVSRDKLLSALNQRECSINIFSIVFYCTKETLYVVFIDVDSSSSIITLQHAYLLTLYVF